MEENKAETGIGAALHDLFKEVFALQATLSRVMDKAHERAGLSTPQRKIIQLLKRLGTATVPDIATNLGVSRQSVQVVCNDLLSRELLEFTDNPRHKRSKLATLTESGHRAFQQAQENEYQAIEQVMPEIELEKTRETGRILAHVRHALENLPASP